MFKLSALLAAVDGTLTPRATPPGYENLPTDIGSVITSGFTFLYWLVGVIAVVMVAYSGFLFITSAGNPQKTKTAMQSVLYAVIGFIVALLAQAIIELVTPIAPTTNADIGTVVTNGIQIFMWVIGISAVVMVIIGGLLYVTSGGDPGRTKTAKDAILYAIVGLIVAIMGGAIITFVQAQL